MKTYKIRYVEQYSADYLVNADNLEDAKEALCEEICEGMSGPGECEAIAAEV